MSPKKILEFKSKKATSRRSASASSIIDEGALGILKYRVFKRGVIHIFNNAETLLFKKDCDVFENEVDKLKLNDLSDGGSVKIEGSGDNDTLIFSCKKGDIEIKLEKRSYGMLTKLKKILNGGKKK